MDDDDLDDDVWDKLNGPAGDGVLPDGDDEDDDEIEVEVEVGPPVRVTFVIRADKIPVAPWAQGWRVGALGPDNGQIMLVCEHDIDLSPVAQLSAVTGLLATLKAAQLDLVWWAVQTRGPLITDTLGVADLDSEFSDLLGGDMPDPPPDVV